MNRSPGQVKKTKPDIYTKYIIPIIQRAKPGDGLLYVSTTCFFGYWSIDAHVFRDVVEELHKAKER